MHPRSGQRSGGEALGSGAEAIGAAIRTFKSVTSILLMALLTAFFFYFFSTGYGQVLSFWEGLIPERKKGRVIELVQRMDIVIAGFVRGRLTIALCLMLLYTVGYWFIGVPAPLLLGPIIGALAIVPFVSSIALPLAMILMALQPSSWEWQTAWWWIVLGPFLVYLCERILDDYILTPLIQGKHTDMGMPAILFASLAGGVLAGVYGLLIAIPVAACLKILLNEIFWPRFKAWAEGKERDFLPIGEAPEREVLIKRQP
jgi:predicted PurR-regulated permease PerM